MCPAFGGFTKGVTGMAITFGRVPKPAIDERILSNSEAVQGHGWDDLGQRSPKFIVLHRMVGTLWGTDSYFRDPSVASLTDYGMGIAAVDGAANAGKILQWNDPWGRRAGWASGPVNQAYGDGLAVVQKYGINAVNRDGVSIETSGTNEPLDETSWASLVHLCAWLADTMEVPYTSLPLNPHTGINLLVWHQEFTIGTGKTCPFTWLMENTNRLYNDVAAFMKRYQEGDGQAAPAPARTRTVTVRFEVPIRKAPGFGGEIVKMLDAGTSGTVISGPKEVDGLDWYDLSIPGFGTGWVQMSIVKTLEIKG